MACLALAIEHRSEIFMDYCLSSPDDSYPMRSFISVLVGVLGVLLTVTNCIAVAKTLMSGYTFARELMVRQSDVPAQLGALIGETIVGISSRGLFTVLPAMLLYVALAPLRLRQRWFYISAQICSLYFLLLLPFGTLYGIVLLVAIRRRRGEFTASA